MTTSEQARADAMADAETLYMMAASVSAHCYLGPWDGPICELCNEAVRVLRAMGEAESDARRAENESGRWGRIQCAYANGASAARAAFRAVPGLRGE